MNGKRDLGIAAEKLAYIIAKAREYDAEIAPIDGGERPAPGADDERSILEATSGNPTRRELWGAISSLNDDERSELVALTWLGRGDFEDSEWAEALAQARQTRSSRTARYLVGTPLLADYLEEGVSRLGFALEDLEP
jgi:hypothetical protein